MHEATPVKTLAMAVFPELNQGGILSQQMGESQGSDNESQWSDKIRHGETSGHTVPFVAEPELVSVTSRRVTTLAGVQFLEVIGDA